MRVHSAEGELDPESVKSLDGAVSIETPRVEVQVDHVVVEFDEKVKVIEDPNFVGNAERIAISVNTSEIGWGAVL